MEESLMTFFISSSFGDFPQRTGKARSSGERFREWFGALRKNTVGRESKSEFSTVVNGFLLVWKLSKVMEVNQTRLVSQSSRWQNSRENGAGVNPGTVLKRTRLRKLEKDRSVTSS